MAGESRAKPWGGRFRKAVDQILERFSASVHFDQRLYRHDIAGSIAHARMLARQGLLSNEEADVLEDGLRKVESEIASGRFEPRIDLEDIHMNIEARLGELVGAVAGKLHTGRSRNDQIATDFTRFLREASLGVRREIAELRAVLVGRAEGEVDVVLPGYTHLQRAQPIRLAHHWLAHFQILGRDDARLRDAAARLRLSPLGAGALAGSTLPIDRASTARELGFEAPNPNSLDAVAARDGAAELLAALAILMVNLSRLAEEIVLWSSSEFGFIELDDAFATGSSLMPQKKNPDGAELVRGKSGRVVGDLVTLLVVLKGLPLTYNRDLQEDKEPVFDAVETATGSLAVMAGTVRSLRVNADAMRAAASDPLLLATDLAEHLVRAGVAFREAHEIVGRLVGHAAERGTPLDRLDRATLRDFHPALDANARDLLSLEGSLEARSLVGGPARVRVEEALRDARSELERLAAEIDAAEA